VIKANKAELKFARWRLDANRKLVKKNFVAEEKLQEAEKDFGKAKTAVASSQFLSDATWAITNAVKLFPEYVREYLGRKELQTNVLERKLSAAEEEIAKCRRDLKRAILRSPINGVVLKRLVKNEQVLPGGAVLLEIGDLSDLQVTANILSQDVLGIRKGNAVDIRGPSLGETPLKGTVVRIKPAGITKISSLGVEQQRVPVVIGFQEGALKTLAKADRSLGVDYRVHVRVYTQEKTDARIIPRTSLFRGTGQKWEIYTVQDGKARLMPVGIGLMNDREAEIRKGLKPGDTVIVAPPNDLKDGDSVRILPG
jgi:HlyD family secretion protein